jgi:hypothetical protein
MYLVRWRYEWPDKPSKYGMWSNPGPKNDLATKAWFHNKEGLTLAAIEAKNIETKEIKIIVACDGHDFVNFKWLAAASLNPIGLKGSVTPLTRLLGLTLVTREYDYNVYHNGIVEKKARDPEEMKINYATFGR